MTGICFKIIHGVAAVGRAMDWPRADQELWIGQDMKPYYEHAWVRYALTLLHYLAVFFK